MVTRKGERPLITRQNHLGGEGTQYTDRLMDPKRLGRAGRIFQVSSLTPGCSIGYHIHETEFEIFYILSGIGEYNDNGTPIPVSAGDVAYCGPGSGHAVRNTGEGELVYLAFVGNPE